MYRPRLLQFLVVFLIFGVSRTTVTSCIHCTMFRNGTCLHPLGFIPPTSECGATYAKCVTTLLKILDVRASTERQIDFGVNFG
ncbi:hypothetical protein ILUMI_05477, partial [Ignelater luminosus]